MLTTHIVTSLDGVKFSVQFESRNQAQAEAGKRSEEKFAASKNAIELDARGDFHRIASGAIVPSQEEAFLPCFTPNVVPFEEMQRRIAAR